MPTENLELYFPLRIEINESLADSGGAGFYRGGNAQRTLYHFLCTGEVSLHDDRWFTKPWGANGGKPGARSRKVLHQKSEGGGKPVVKVLPSKTDYVHVEPGDILEWITWGGGGLGDALARPAEKVALEVHRRLVTLQGARENYGVVVKPEDFSVDIAATTKLRDEMCQLRNQGEGEEAYNRGGLLKDLIQTCFEETGQHPPTPQWAKDSYGPHVALPYVQDWYARMRKEGFAGWGL